MGKYFIDSYLDCVKAFETVRTPVLGKPLNGKSVRLYRDRDLSFRLTMNERTFAVIHPDDTITFVLDSTTLRNTIATSLVYTMNRFLPMGLYRVGAGRYRIGRPNGWQNVKHLPEYIQSIKFNLTTGECLNPQPDRSKRLNKDARKVWTKALAAYRKGLFARLRLGVVGDVNSSDRWFTSEQLFQWMQAGEYPDVLFNHLTYQAGREYKQMTAQFESLINHYRDALRKMYGVFDD